MSIRYKELAEELLKLTEEYIDQGINKMPSENDICQNYKVSRQTVRQSMDILKEAGIIESRRGSGTYITGRRLHAGGNEIAVLISNQTEYIYPELLADIHKHLLEAGFTERIYETGNKTRKEREILNELLNNPPRGMIVEGCKSALPNPNIDLYNKLMDKGVFVIFLFNYYAQLGNPSYIKGNNEGGACELTRHLIDKGHTKIGGIFKVDDMQGVERYKGFADTLIANGIELPDEHIGWFSSMFLDAFRLTNDSKFIRDMLVGGLSDCTALVCYNDEIAYMAFKELKAMGLKIPDDVAIGSFDNTPLSNYSDVSITTLSHRSHEMGTLVARACIQKAKGLPVKSQEVPWVLSVRESTAGLI